MASNPPQDCCTFGVRIDGIPRGSTVNIADVSTYVTGDKQSKNVLLLLTDILGHKFPNSQLVADAYASQGYYVVAPDIYNGDPTKLGEGLSDAWLHRHGIDETEPNIHAVVKYIKSELKPAQLSAIGYCFGARYVIRLLGTGTIDVGAAAHPSFVQIEEVAAVKKPLIIIGAETDKIYTPELRAKTEAKLKEINATYFTTLISGTEHGFTVRGDPRHKWTSIARSKAFNDSVWWFKLFE